MRHLLILAVLMMGTNIYASHHEAKKITFTNKLVDGKKVWLPKVTKVKKNTIIEATLVNTLKDPHGFEPVGLSAAVVVPGKGTKKMTFVATKSGKVELKCHMHPAHVGAILEVE